MNVRAKFRLTKIAELYWDKTAKELTFNAEYDDTIPDDMRFYKATPNGQFVMTCNNPVVLEELQLGQQYYFDMSPAFAVPSKLAPGEGAQPSA